MSTTFEEIATKIIKEQALIIGPLAWNEVKKVPGLKVIDEAKGDVNIAEGNPVRTLDELVGKYARLFGGVSVEVCKEAARPFLKSLSPVEIPASLR